MSTIYDSEGVVNEKNPLSVNLTEYKDYHYSFVGDVGVSKLDLTLPRAITNILYISNDGDSTLFINFDNNLINIGSVNNENGTISLLSGECLSDFRRKITSISLQRATGSGSVRILGV